MNKEEILENNKLIAEFVDLTPHSIFPDELQAPGAFMWMAVQVNAYSDYAKEEDEFNCFEEFFQFHKSWDWLMPVVEKIELLKIKDYNIRVSIDSVRCLISITHFYEGSIKIFYKNIYNDNDSKMERIYKLIIEFIKYYNKLNEAN